MIRVKGYTNHVRACGNKGQKLLVECLHCGIVYKSINSIYTHAKKHDIHKVTKGKDWRYLPKRANKKTEPKKVALTPETQFIDIPIVLRIPLTIGKAQIVNI